MSTTVFIVEDHPSMQQAYRMLFEMENDLHLCGMATTAAEAQSHIPTLQPDIVLVDLSLPDASGMDLVRDLNAALPSIHYVIVSGNDARDYNALALQAGASGFLDKRTASETLIPTLRHLLRSTSPTD